ncbi:MAG: hypothetical protein FWF12_00465 [Betaproteobacteria bacterium]|nr:hypothetical protein [Betaproteobacteria bacterium]
MLLRPNQNCRIRKTTGETDVYGVPIAGPQVVERCAIIRLNIKNEKSSVRADTSASRGNARELVADTMFLLTKNTVAAIDDLLIFGDQKYWIVSKFPRHDLQGKLDHYEVTCSIWRACDESASSC